MQMSSRSLLLAVLCAATIMAADTQQAEANYYSTYVYYPASGYYYCYYYYKPTTTYTGYRSHHCYYYPSYSTQYIYFYNPYSRVYWGRYDLKAKGYSLLAEKDRKSELKDIPNEAFPEPDKMPLIPEVKGGKDLMATPPTPPKSKPNS
jgi:hypothetical protein